MGMKVSLYDDLNNSMSIFIDKLLFDITHSSTQNLQVRMYITAFILPFYSVLLLFFSLGMHKITSCYESNVTLVELVSQMIKKSIKER